MFSGCSQDGLRMASGVHRYKSSQMFSHVALVCPLGLVSLVDLVVQISGIGFVSEIDWVGLVGLVHLVSLFGLVGLVDGVPSLANSGYFLAILSDSNYFQMEIMFLMIQNNLMIPKSPMV